MRLEFYGKLISRESDKFRNDILPETVDVSPSFTVSNSRNIRDENAERVNEILREEMKESKIVKEFPTMSSEDVKKQPPIGKSRTESVKIGDAYIFDDAVIADINMDNMIQLKP